MNKKRYGADLSRILVVDVEATCWETREDQGMFPNEIIEIGMCSLNIDTLEVSGKSTYLVKPQFSHVSPFCTELTGWTQTSVQYAPEIDEVLQNITTDFKMTKDTVWASYGEFDRVKLSSDVGLKSGLYGLYEIERFMNPFASARTHLNVKTLMAFKEKLSNEMSMERALKYYGIELEGRHHNGADDAWNIAKILKKVLW